MYHYNIIHETDAETIQEDKHRKIAQQMHSIYNKVRYEFSSGDYFKEVDLKKKEVEIEQMTEKLVNPPMVMKKTPLINTGNSRKMFDSADYYMEKYGLIQRN